MIEENAVENWKKILKLNQDIISSKEKRTTEEVRIPFTPIEVRPKTIYHLFKLLYPRFVNQREGVADLIISDNENKILGILLYTTKIPGIHDSYERLDSNLLDLEDHSLRKKDKLFTELQDKISDKKDILISHIRIIKKEGIDKINQYFEGIQESSFQNFLAKFLDLIQSLIQQKLITIYPKPNVLKFLEEIVNLLGRLKMSDVLKYISELIPEVNSILVLQTPEVSFILQFQFEKTDSENLKMNFKLWSAEELGLDLRELREKEIIELVYEEFKLRPIYLFHIEDILSIFKELFELRRPIKLKRLKLLLKKVLFGFRSFEIRWFKNPRPLIYNALIRFLMKMIKININLKKVAHWEIPEIIFNVFTRNFGLNSKIGLILTDFQQIKGNNKSSIKNRIKEGYDASFLLEFEQEALKDVKVIQKDEIIGENHGDPSLQGIRGKLSEKYGYIAAVLAVDKFLLGSTVKRLIFHPSRLNFIARMSLIKQWKNEEYFKIYPELPIFQFIENTGSYRLLKLMLPILIDWYEF